MQSGKERQGEDSRKRADHLAFPSNVLWSTIFSTLQDSLQDSWCSYGYGRLCSKLKSSLSRNLWDIWFSFTVKVDKK